MDTRLSSNNDPTKLESPSERLDTVIIGGGQCGLSVGYYLAKEGRRFAILDHGQRVGDVWRQRYDSLRLYTPAKLDGLPGRSFPAPRNSFPSGHQMADFLESYAADFELPVRTGIHVSHLRRSPLDSERFWVSTSSGIIDAANVVVANGGQQSPTVPSFAGELDPDIRQLHSNDYRNPSQLKSGPVLIVGASHSGADLAMECASEHETWLAGPSTGELPINLEGRSARALSPLLWFAAQHVLTVRHGPGREFAQEARVHGGPLLRYKKKDLAEAGVIRTASRVVGVKDGMPVLDDDRIIRVENVIWCTGFHRDFSWIQFPIFDEIGYPRAARGVVADVPGLYFSGLIFQFSFSSMLVGGSGRDARYVAQHLQDRSRTSTAAAA